MTEAAAPYRISVEHRHLSAKDDIRIHMGIHLEDPHPRNYTPLSLTIREEDGTLSGGLLGCTVWEWLLVNALWVERPLRRKGRGKDLLATAEAEAWKRGCTRAQLSTFDWQQRAFYERRGYAVYAQLDGFPAGHTRFHLRKDLAPPDGEQDRRPTPTTEQSRPLSVCRNGTGSG